MTAAVALGVTVAGAAGVALLLALFTHRWRPRRAEPVVATTERSMPPQANAAVEPAEDDTAPEGVPDDEENPAEVVRFDVHVIFAERRETHLIVDVLADFADGRGAVLGVPASLILQRPPSALAENVLLSLMEETADHGCQVEVDLTVEQASVKMSPSGRELSIPIRAASGLPLAS